MSNFYESVRNERQMKALTGLGQEKFELLLESFSKSLEELKSESYQVNRQQRSRRPGGGQKGGLPTAQDKLFFILFYFKTYPTFDNLGFTFRISTSKACENVKKLLPILNHAQSKLKVQPLRKLSKVSDLESALETLNEAKDSIDNTVVWEEEVSFADQASIPALKKAKDSQTSSKLEQTLRTLYERENSSEPPDLEEEVSCDAQVLIPALKKTKDSQSKLGQKLRAIYERENSSASQDLGVEASCDAQDLTPALNQTEVNTINPTNKEVLIDVTERTHFRHKNNRKQKKHYSGKKGTHTVKNTIMSTPKRSVVFLGKTFEGSVHDYKMLKKEVSPKKAWWSKINACVDLGYQGIKTDYENPENVSIPNKKPRKSKSNPKPSLTKTQKQENKKVGQRRVFVEHTIGGMKAFHILSTRFRNRSNNFADEAAFLVAGLWNLKIGSNFNRL
jgi:hypothetical protein